MLFPKAAPVRQKRKNPDGWRRFAPSSPGPSIGVGPLRRAIAGHCCSVATGGSVVERAGLSTLIRLLNMTSWKIAARTPRKTSGSPRTSSRSARAIHAPPGRCREILFLTPQFEASRYRGRDQATVGTGAGSRFAEFAFQPDFVAREQ